MTTRSTLDLARFSLLIAAAAITVSAATAAPNGRNTSQRLADVEPTAGLPVYVEAALAVRINRMCPGHASPQDLKDLGYLALATGIDPDLEGADETPEEALKKVKTPTQERKALVAQAEAAFRAELNTLTKGGTKKDHLCTGVREEKTRRFVDAQRRNGNVERARRISNTLIANGCPMLGC